MTPKMTLELEVLSNLRFRLSRIESHTRCAFWALSEDDISPIIRETVGSAIEIALCDLMDIGTELDKRIEPETHDAD